MGSADDDKSAGRDKSRTRRSSFFVAPKHEAVLSPSAIRSLWNSLHQNVDKHFIMLIINGLILIIVLMIVYVVFGRKLEEPTES